MIMSEIQCSFTIKSGYFRRLNVRMAIRPTPSAPSARDEGSGTVVMSRLQLASVLWLPADKSARNNDHCFHLICIQSPP